ncbi:MAG: cupin domain-containing protein [Chloroflexi bacterium]|nr:MAG: cupin domain-containing protein [Chloroflexota bacterium]
MEGKEPRLIRARDRHRQTGQTAGMIREEAVNADGLWVGVVRTEPGRFSSWHHHGAHRSVIYVISGQVQVECGPGGKTTLQARPGDCVYLPPGEIHREGNGGLEESEIVVVRSGEGELVVNVAGPAA